MKKIFIAVFVVLFLNSSAQTEMLAGFTTFTDGNVSETIKIGNKLFFTAADSVHGRELWITDGTTAGTYMVKDIVPGSAGSLSINFYSFSGNFKGILFFQVNTSGPERGLWRSDGTESGTWLVHDLYIDSYNYYLTDFAATDSVLFFAANSTTLWRTNGTASGTYILDYFQIIRNLATFKNNLYFSAGNNNAGEELWKTNGATGKTVLLKDLNGAFGASLPCNFYATGNALYFTAATNAGWELWKTTGSESGTQIVKDINPGGNGALDYYTTTFMTSIGNTLYFRGNDGVAGFQLWKTDGTETNTVKVSNIPDGVSQYCRLPIVQNKILFNSYNGQYYWQYDPATNSTSQTGYPFKIYFERNNGKNAGFFGSKLFFAGMDSLYGGEMWLSGGTLNSTRRLQETFLLNNYTTTIYSTAFNSIFGMVNGKILFKQSQRTGDSQVPLFAYDTTLNAITSFPPSILTPVSIANKDAMHLIWNRIEGATKYQVRYRLQNAPASWVIKDVQFSFANFSLSANTEYYFQVRAFCNNVWTDWSDRLLYKSSVISDKYALYWVAERAENATTMRIYWVITSKLEKLQIRYRPVGSATWLRKQNASGYIRLTELLPGTFYEYQYRAFTSGSWLSWSPSSFYFAMPEDNTSAMAAQITKRENALSLLIAPNPAKDIIYIKTKIPSNSYFILTDATGNVLKTGILNNNSIDISGLKTGVFTIVIQKENFRMSGKVLKQ